MKQSIEKTHGKTVTVSHFKQLLTLCPYLYEHSWERVAGQSGPQLTIEFGTMGQPCPPFSAVFFERRKEEIRTKVIEICLLAYKEFVKKNFPNVESLNKVQVEILTDPIKCKMWHSSFDPHSQVPTVSEAELKVPKHMPKNLDMTQVLEKYANQT